MQPRVSWRAVLAGAVLVVMMALAWFSPMVVGEQFTTVPTHETAVYPWKGVLPSNGDRYAQSDQADLNSAWETLQEQATERHTVPLWNPLSFGGQPLMANGSSGVLYPPRVVLSAIASAATTHTLLSFLHVAAAGIFMYLLLLDLGLGIPAAVFGAVAWMFGTFTLDWIQLEVVAPVFAWLPAGALSVRHAVTGSRRWVAALASVVGVLLLGTHLPFAGVTCAAFLAYGALLAVFGSDGQRVRRLARLAGGTLLGAALAAVTLVPTAELLAQAQRSTFDYRTLLRAFLLAPSDLRYALVPPPHGVGAQAAMHMHQALFVGTLTVVLALGGACLRRPGTGLARGCVVVTVFVAVGGPGAWIAYHLIPGMQTFRPYSRLLFITAFGLAVLGAVGLAWVLEKISGGARHGHGPGRGCQEARRRTVAAFAVGGVVVAFTAVQLGVYGRHENPPFASGGAIYPPTPLLRALAVDTSDGWPDRILPLRLDSVHAPMLYAGESVVLGIDSAGGYDSVVPPRTVDVWEVSGGKSPEAVVGQKGPQDFVPTWELATTRFDLLPRLGVDRIVSAPEVLVDPAAVLAIDHLGWKRTYQGNDGIVFTWTGAPVGPHVVGRAQVVRGDLAAMQAFTNPRFDDRTDVVLESGGTYRGGGGGHVVSAHRGINTLTLTVNSAGGYLVIPDMWDPGWSATVDGHARPVLRANFNQQALQVPPGSVRVSLRYTPPGFRSGQLVSALAVVLLIALLAPLPGRQTRGEGSLRP